MSLASVIIDQTYPKLKSNRPLSLFHRKFWGRSMEDEMAEWRKAQTEIGGQPEDEDQDKSEAMEEDQDQGKDKGKPDKDENESMPYEDEDEDEATDEDDDILPGCYVLDISIDKIAPKSLWIRADYIRIFDFLEAHYDQDAKSMTIAPSAVLTGQPGIGKSFWIYYAARRILAEKRPFIWFYKAKYFLFVDDGVYNLPSDWDHDDFRCVIWTLVGSDQSRDGVPEILIPHGTRLFVVYVTAPARSRWSRMDKTTQMIVVIMNPWRRKEMQRAARLSPLKEITEEHVNEIFDQLGPVARLCVQRSSKQLAQYRITLNQEISRMTADDIKKLTDQASGLTTDAVSYNVCLLSRQEQNVVHSQAVVAPITDFIKSRLSNQFRNLERAEQIRLYKLFEKVPTSRTTAGIFYEAIAQNRLQNGMLLELVPMVKLEKGKGSKTLPRWYSSHTLMRNKSLEAARRWALGEQLTVNIQPKETREYTDNGLRSIKPEVFYVPALDNQTAFHSFILLNDYLYIFQITIVSSYDINQGLIAVVNSCSFPLMERWRFVFIIPPNLTLAVPQPSRLDLRSLSPFSAMVCINKG